MNKIFALGLAIGLILTPAFIRAEDTAAAPVMVGNKICPVSGEKIVANSSMGKPVTYEYKGKVYNLCCGMCPKNFAKDPDKYSKIAEDEVKAEAAAATN